MEFTISEKPKTPQKKQKKKTKTIPNVKISCEFLKKSTESCITQKIKNRFQKTKNNTQSKKQTVC